MLLNLFRDSDMFISTQEKNFLYRGLKNLLNTFKNIDLTFNKPTYLYQFIYVKDFAGV